MPDRPPETLTHEELLVDFEAVCFTLGDLGIYEVGIAFMADDTVKRYKALYAELQKRLARS